MVSTISRPDAVLDVPTTEATEAAISILLDSIREAIAHSYQESALTYFEAGDYNRVKLIWLAHPTDGYCKALNFLGGAMLRPAAAVTIVGEAMNAIAEQRAIDFKRHMGPELAKILAGES